MWTYRSVDLDGMLKGVEISVKGLSMSTSRMVRMDERMVNEGRRELSHYLIDEILREIILGRLGRFPPPSFYLRIR